jgi:hypothetical protein
LAVEGTLEIEGKRLGELLSLGVEGTLEIDGMRLGELL